MRKLYVFFFTLIVCLFLSISGEWLEAANCKDIVAAGTSFSQSLIDLVENERLTAQEDDALIDAGYVVPDGGLCGPTIVNIMMSALDRFDGKRFDVTHRGIMKVTDFAEIRLRKNVKGGLISEDLITVVKSEARRRGHKIKVSGLTMDGSDGLRQTRVFTPQSFAGEADGSSVFILSTKIYKRTRSGRRGEFRWDHVSIGLDFDPEKMTIKVVEPLAPNEIFKAKLVRVNLPDTRKQTYKLVFDKPRNPDGYLTEIINVDMKP
jgi:hypothetical protein